MPVLARMCCCLHASGLDLWNEHSPMQDLQARMQAQMTG